ncbi:hypothetical protein ACEPPN_005909 [Leptodophora sp. 'Broadleaf-Isolate-01']
MAYTVGIAGITGKFARCVVSNLLKQPGVSIRGFCRDPTKLPESIRSSPRVHLTKGEAGDKSALNAFAKTSDVVVCCYLGNEKLMNDGQKHLIDACEAQGVRRYLASDYSLDFTKLEYGQLASKDPMKHVKEYLEKQKVVKGVHVLIGVFMDTFVSPFFGVVNAKEAKLSYWGTGEEIWESTSYANAAEFVAAVTLDVNAVGIQNFLGDRKNIFQIAEAFEKAFGKKPTLENKGTLDELKKTMLEVQAKDPRNIYAYIALFYNYYCTNGQTYLSFISNKYPHIKPETFEAFMKARTLEQLLGSSQVVGSNI